MDDNSTVSGIMKRSVKSVRSQFRLLFSKLQSCCTLQGRRSRSDHSDLGRTKNLFVYGSKPYIFRVLIGPMIFGLRFFSNGRTNLVLLPPPLRLQDNSRPKSPTKVETKRKLQQFTVSGGLIMNGGESGNEQTNFKVEITFNM